MVVAVGHKHREHVDGVLLFCRRHQSEGLANAVFKLVDNHFGCKDNIFFLRIIRIKQIFSYLCTQVMQMNNKIVNIVLAVIAVCLLALCVASVMNVK